MASFHDNSKELDFIPDNIIDRLSYPELCFIMDAIKRRRPVLRESIDEGMTNLDSTDNNDDKIVIANDLITYVLRSAGDEYRDEHRRLRPFILEVIPPSGQHFTFRIPSGSTGSFVKRLIAKHNGKSVSIMHLRTSTGGGVDDHRQMEAYLTSDRLRLYLQYLGDTFDVFVKGLSKQYILRSLTENMYVREIRRQVGERENVNGDNLFLSCNSKPLEDGRTLGYYNIGMDSTIVVSMRLRGG